MVVIVLVVLGLIAMFLKTISVSKSSEIRRPRTFIFGGLIVVFAITANFLSAIFKGPVDSYGVQITTISSVVAYAIPLLVPFIAVFFLKQPKSGQ